MALINILETNPCKNGWWIRYNLLFMLQHQCEILKQEVLVGTNTKPEAADVARH